MGDSMGIGPETHPLERDFRSRLTAIPAPDVLELGTLRWEPDRPTHHQGWHPGARWIRSDIAPGPDVDTVADAHDLAPFSDDQFDVFLAVSVWEHLARPWEATRAVARVLRPGGFGLIVTHQTFPVHGYPSDFFRYTTEGLASVLAWAGLTARTGYQYPARIVPPVEVTRWNPAAEAWLNVVAVFDG